MISQLNQKDFIEYLKLAEGLPETIPYFTLEYYIGPSFIFLYKTISSKTFKTTVQLISPLADSEDDIITVIWKGKQITFNEFMDDIIVNYKGIELIQPSDYYELLLKHNHDMHTHAGIGFNDILLSVVHGE